MAHPHPWFPSVTGDDLLYTPQKSNFEALANSILGDAGTVHDGYDPVFNGANQSVGGLGQILQTLRDCIAKVQAAANVLGQVDTSATDAEINLVLKQIQASAVPIGDSIAGLALPSLPTSQIGSAPPAPGVSVASLPGTPIGTTIAQTGLGVLAAGAGAAAGAAAAGVGAAAATGGELAAMAAFLTNPVTLVVAAVILVAILSTLIGHGCGQPCIESAKLEQVYEVAADLIGHAVTLGMVPQAQWEQLYTAIFDQGQHAFNQLEIQGDQKAPAGLDNMRKVLYALHPVAPAHKVAYQWNTLLQSWLKMTNTAGWYPDSLQAGENLAQGLLANILVNT